MKYTVCRMESRTGMIALLDSFGTEDEAKMYLANAVEEECAKKPDLTDRDTRDLVDKALREQRFEVLNAEGKRESFYYIDKD